MPPLSTPMALDNCLQLSSAIGVDNGNCLQLSSAIGVDNGNCLQLSSAIGVDNGNCLQLSSAGLWLVRGSPWQAQRLVTARRAVSTMGSNDLVVDEDNLLGPCCQRNDWQTGR